LGDVPRFGRVDVGIRRSAGLPGVVQAPQRSKAWIVHCRGRADGVIWSDVDIAGNFPHQFPELSLVELFWRPDQRQTVGAEQLRGFGVRVRVSEQLVQRIDLRSTVSMNT